VGSTPAATAAARIFLRGRALTAAAGAVYDQGQGQGDPTGRPYGVSELLLILETCPQGSGAIINNPLAILLNPPLGKGDLRTALGKQCNIIVVSVQRSAISHQLNEQIQEDMLGDTVDYLSSESLNFLFWLKADC
jgi:hypothetical protein